MGPPLVSSWTTYPSKYKFISFAIKISKKAKYTIRTHVGFVTTLENLGGFIVLPYLFFNFIAAFFANRRFESIIANRLFHLSPSDPEITAKIKRHEADQAHNYKDS